MDEKQPTNDKDSKQKADDKFAEELSVTKLVSKGQASHKRTSAGDENQAFPETISDSKIAAKEEKDCKMESESEEGYTMPESEVAEKLRARQKEPLEIAPPTPFRFQEAASEEIRNEGECSKVENETKECFDDATMNEIKFAEEQSVTRPLPPSLVAFAGGKGKDITMKEKKFAEEQSVTRPLPPSLKSPAQPPLSEKEGGANKTLQHAPPYTFEQHVEAQRQKNAVDQINLSTQEPQRQENAVDKINLSNQEPGAFRIRGVEWDGSEGEDDNDLSRRSVVTQNREAVTANTNEDVLIPVKAHAVRDPVLVAARPDPWWRRNRWWIVASVVVLSLVALGLGLGLGLNVEPVAPTEAPTTVRKGVEDEVWKVIETEFPEATLSGTGNAAFNWVVDRRDEQGEKYTDNDIIQQYSLLTLFLATSNSSTFEELDDAEWNIYVSNECNWNGIECVDETVTSVNLTNKNLHGTIPPEFAMLSHLSTLDLSDNNLRGSLPSEMFSMTKLTILDLSKNKLSGGIPNTIYKSEQLREINLSRNQMSSNIPTEIGSLGFLSSLNLAHNKMTGSLPSEIGLMKSLVTFDGRNNKFSLELPKEMGQLTALEELLLQNNSLLGPLPPEWRSMSSLRIWNMSHNHIFDKIPSDLWHAYRGLKNLEVIDLSYNLLTGDNYFNSDFDKNLFGDSWAKLSSLNLGHNFIRGTWTTPQDIGFFRNGNMRMPNLEELDISSNFLTGAVPRNIFDRTNLRILNLGKSGLKFNFTKDNGGLEGLSTFVKRFPSLKKLNVSNCGVEGNIPADIEMMNNIELIDLSFNKLKGTIPPGIGSLSMLESLRLDSNDLTGLIPVDIFNNTELKYLDLSGNQLNGSIPREIGALKNLAYLNLESNLLSGSIPTELGMVVQLEFLSLTNLAKANSTIPTEIGLLSRLRYLDLHSTNLRGRIPTQLGMLGRLHHFDLFDNALTGITPTELGMMSQLRYFDLSINHLKSGGNLTVLGKLTDLEHVSIHSNDLTGNIPTEVGKLTKLRHFDVNNNQLSGSIPTEFGKVINLEVLHLEGNILTGYIPKELNYMAKLRHLVLARNSLSGHIPFENQSLPEVETIDIEENLNLIGSIPQNFCKRSKNPTMIVDVSIYCSEIKCLCCKKYDEVLCRVSPISSSSLIPTMSPSLSQSPSIFNDRQTPLPSFRPDTLPPTPFPITPSDTLPPISRPPIQPCYTADGCFLTVDIDCKVDGGSYDCASAVIPRTRCEDRPLELVFRYNGGICEQSDNIQHFDIFQCFDFYGGPPVDVGALSFITVTDIKGQNILYHYDTVAVGEEFTVADQPFYVEAYLNLTVWRNSNTSPENMLQTLVFQSSCSQDLFLADRFGAHQLTAFVNEAQGLQTNSLLATVMLNVEAGQDTVILRELILSSNYGTVNFTDQFNGFVLHPGRNLTPAPSFEIVLNEILTNNNFFAIVSGESWKGCPCSDSGFLSFSTGLATPPHVPTRWPTNAPTRTPVPTEDPDVTACAIQASVSYAVTNPIGLENFRKPTVTQCSSGGFPRELQFIYRGGSCPGSTFRAQPFACQGTADEDEVWITIISENQNILWNGIITRNTFIDLHGIDDSIEITISTIERGRAGRELQSMTFSTTCVPESDLTLKKTFGALELVAFTATAPDDGVVVNAAYARVEINYAVELESGTSTRAVITGATSISGPDDDPVELSYIPPSDAIGPRDKHVFEKKVEVLDLMNQDLLSGITYNLNVWALSASNAILPCESSDSVTFYITE